MLEPHEYLSQREMDRIAAEARASGPMPRSIKIAYGVLCTALAIGVLLAAIGAVP